VSDKEKKQAYVQKLEAQAEVVQAEIDKLSAKASKVNAEAKLEMNRQIDELRIKRDATREKMRELSQAGDSAWRSQVRRRKSLARPGRCGVVRSLEILIEASVIPEEFQH